MLGITMPFCIQDILDNVPLRSRLLGGGAGATRHLRWAHVCELADPTEWLGEGDLLMTTGIGIPHTSEEQREYLKRLATAKVAGLMIGENMQAPADISALQDQAESLGFPLLLTHYSVPFSAVARAIVDASRQEEHERRSAVTRVYESARIGLRGLGLGELLKRLSADVKSDLYLFDSGTLEPWQDGIARLPEGWRKKLAQRRVVSDSVSRCTDGDTDALLMTLPSLNKCEILVVGGKLIDYGMLHHLVAVLGIELERVQVENERSLRLGSELLDDLLHSRLSEQAALERMEQLSSPPSHSCLASSKPPKDVPPDWQERLRRRGMALLVRNLGDELIVLLANGDDALKLQAELGCQMGVSNRLISPGRAVEALREARLALAHCDELRSLVRYTDAQDEHSWLPSSLEEARRIHKRILGTLTEYDRQQGGHLQHTLLVFLQQNRSWQKASDLLSVHKQTLVYRVRRIEEITGRSLDSTEDVAILWIALRAAQLAGIRE